MLCGGDETRPHAAGQQQRLLPGQRDSPGSTGTSPSEQKALLRVHAPAGAACACRQPVLRRRKFFQGRSIRGASQGHRLVRARRPRDDRRGLERRLRPLPRRAALPATRSTKWTSAASRSSATRCCCCSTRTTIEVSFTLPGARSRSRTGSASSTRFDPQMSVTDHSRAACATGCGGAIGRGRSR